MEIIRIFGAVCDNVSSAECDRALSTIESRAPNPDLSTSDITDMFNVVYAMAAVVAMGFIVWGGIQYINSTGDPGKVAKAKNTIVFAVAGLVVVLLASVITNIALEATK